MPIPVLRLPVAAALLMLAMPASALDFIVNSTADVPEETPGDGQCNPVGAVGNTCTLRAAVMEANEHAGAHNIFLPSGTYVLDNVGSDEDAALTGDLDIISDITIINGTDNQPVIFGNYSDRVFDVHDGARLKLINIHVAGGQANEPGTVHGGGFRVAAGATLELEDSTVSGNLANIGGGIYSDGQVVITGSDFYHNVLVDDQVDIQFTDGTAILNRAILAVYGSTFRSNGVIPGGEGVVLTGEYAIESRQGFVADPLVLVANSTFFDNTNGLFSDRVDTYISFSTFVNNNSRGVRFLADPGNAGNLQMAIRGSVVYGHTGDCNGIPDDQPEYSVAGNMNASSDQSCGFTGANDFQNIAYPFIGGAGNHGGATMAFMPRPDGVLVDPDGAQCNFLGGTVDQRGKSRPIDGGSGQARCDIGSVEYDPDTDPPIEDALFSDRFESP